MELVSIILTVYKQEKYIEETILSVVNQTYNNRELLIWDDSPDNNCRNIIDKYEKNFPNKIHAWHHKKNKWIQDNMDFLIWKISDKSEYIAVLEGDDVFREDYLEYKIKTFKEHNVDIIYNDISIINENSNIIKESYLKNKWIKMINWTTDIDYIIRNGSPYHSRSTLMFKKSLLHKISLRIPNFNPYNIISDYNFFIQTLYNGTVFWIEENLVFYREHWKNTSKDTYKLFIDLQKLITYYHNVWIINNKTKQIVLSRLYTGIFLIFLKKAFDESIPYSLKELFKQTIKKLKHII